MDDKPSFARDSSGSRKALLSNDTPMWIAFRVGEPMAWCLAFAESCQREVDRFAAENVVKSL
jgi:hypothetical protein